MKRQEPVLMSFFCKKARGTSAHLNREKKASILSGEEHRNVSNETSPEQLKLHETAAPGTSEQRPRIQEDKGENEGESPPTQVTSEMASQQTPKRNSLFQLRNIGNFIVSSDRLTEVERHDVSTKT